MTENMNHENENNVDEKVLRERSEMKNRVEQGVFIDNPLSEDEQARIKREFDRDDD